MGVMEKIKVRQNDCDFVLGTFSPIVDVSSRENNLIVIIIFAPHHHHHRNGLLTHARVVFASSLISLSPISRQNHRSSSWFITLAGDRGRNGPE
jgi:hypothetical protein